MYPESVHSGAANLHPCHSARKSCGGGSWHPGPNQPRQRREMHGGEPSWASGEPDQEIAGDVYPAGTSRRPPRWFGPADAGIFPGPVDDAGRTGSLHRVSGPGESRGPGAGPRAGLPPGLPAKAPASPTSRRSPTRTRRPFVRDGLENGHRKRHALQTPRTQASDRRGPNHDAHATTRSVRRRDRSRCTAQPCPSRDRRFRH
jgi:hypothetical protein